MIPPILGNDIVDLCHRDAYQFHPRFSERICTPFELEYLKKNTPSPALWQKKLWMLWSAKEAAYKAIKQVDSNIQARWKSFEVLPEKKEIICFGKLVLKLIILDDSQNPQKQAIEFIHTFAYSSTIPLEQIHNGISMFKSKNKEHESQEIRLLIAPHLLRVWGIEEKDIKTSKWEKDVSGAPLFYVNGHLFPGCISLSHHGRFMAYAFYLKDTY